MAILKSTTVTVTIGNRVQQSINPIIHMVGASKKRLLEDLVIENASELMEPYETTRFRCPHCRKTWAHKQSCYEHILYGCHLNPATATCATCKFLMDHIFDATQSTDCAMNCAHFELTPAYRPKNCPMWQAKGKV